MSKYEDMSFTLAYSEILFKYEYHQSDFIESYLLETLIKFRALLVLTERN